MTDRIARKINTLLDAFESNTEGIDLIVQALGEPVREVREAAYWLLTEIQEESAKAALRNYLPYTRMQGLHRITGHSEREPSYFVISTDNKALLSNCHSQESKGYAYATVKIWNLQTGQLTHTLPFTHEHIGMGHNGQTIVGHFQHIIEVRKSWETRYPLQLFGSIDISSLTVSSDGSIVAGGGYLRDARSELPGQIEVWDLKTDRVIHRLEWKPIRYTSFCLSLMIIPNTSLLLSQDNERLDHHRLWSLQTGELICVFETSPSWFADAIAHTLNGGFIASGIRDNAVNVWDLNTDRIIYSFPAYSPTAMTPDGKVLAYCNDRNEIVLWDLDVNERICTLPENPSPIQAICLSSDREWVVSYDDAQTIKIYGLPDE